MPRRNKRKAPEKCFPYGWRYRKVLSQQKMDRRLRIVQLPVYYPYAGFLMEDFKGKTLLHSGLYIKYPKNSNRQQYLKRLSAKKARKAKELPGRGNGYRKIYDYKWELD